MRKEISEAFDRVKNLLRVAEAKHNDLERRFQEHVRNQDQCDRVTIEHNPITGMYQWEIKPRVWHRDGYAVGREGLDPYAEGRTATYAEALDAVLYHEALHRLGLPKKPNGITKNY